ncbi:hypothetical protein, partial [Rhizobium leguminosarum]|uniref:hypothetical protein n=1 Tax=Rhizobium leguminosarum TaxID=384 RepID=UPI003F9814EE
GSKPNPMKRGWAARTHAWTDRRSLIESASRGFVCASSPGFVACQAGDPLVGMSGWDGDAADS